jgi:hypothetical protein
VKEQRLVKLIENLLEKRLKGIKMFNDESLFIGYNPLEKIRGALYIWAAVPFNGEEVFCQLRCPNATQIEQCGDISNITIEIQNNKDYKFSYDEMIEIRNYQEKLCKLVLNIPTFDHIVSIVGDNDFVISEKKEELTKLAERFEANKASMTEVEKQTIQTQIKTIELQIGYILPTDTMAFLTQWAMGNDISDIKKITKETFLRAASLAKASNKAPSDYLSGVFTDYNKHEIDAYAISVFDEFMKQYQVTKETKFQWLLGGRRRNSGTLLPKKLGEKSNG